MGFWIAALAASALTALWVVRPLALGRREAAQRAVHDAQVFRDQLSEVDRDIERGVLSAEEGRSARIEISRRLLGAAAEAERTSAHRPAPRLASFALAAAILIGAPMSGLWLHDRIGAADLPDQPASARAAGFRPGQTVAEGRLGEAPPPPPAEAAEALALLEELERRTAGPEADRQGLFLLARTQSQFGRYADAWRSWSRLVEMSGGDAPASVWIAMAESMVLAAGGYASPEAEAALTEGLRREPSNPVARYYMGAAFSQTGRPQSAMEVWLGLLRESPAGAPWREATIAQIDDLAMRAGLPRPEIPPPLALSPEEERAQMLAAVRGLDQRLAEGGGGPMEWAQLVRSYEAMGMADEAAAAAARARAALAPAPEALSAFDAAVAAAAEAQAAAPGPDAAAMEAAAALSPAERTAMIEGMVAGLRERLFADGGEPAEWARLIRALAVLGDGEGAADALARASAAHGADPAAFAIIDRTAREAGVAAP